MEIKEIIKEVKNTLLASGITELCETEWLVAEALGVSRSQMYMVKTLTEHQVDKIRRFASERATHKPLDYITNQTCFFGLNFYVDEGCLIPRPETEILVEEVLKIAKIGDNVLDIGTGSGAIAVAIAKNINANICAVDISKKALQIATKNAKNHDVHINFLQSDIYENVQGVFDIVVSNPPYIPSKDVLKLDKTVKDFEPHSALDGGEDGLDFYRTIVEGLDQYLKVGGHVFFEIGIGQEQDVSNLFGSNYTVSIIKDYAGINRIVKARRNL